MQKHQSNILSLVRLPILISVISYKPYVHTHAHAVKIPQWPNYFRRLHHHSSVGEGGGGGEFPNFQEMVHSIDKMPGVYEWESFPYNDKIEYCYVRVIHETQVTLYFIAIILNTVLTILTTTQNLDSDFIKTVCCCSYTYANTELARPRNDKNTSWCLFKAGIRILTLCRIKCWYFHA